ncbi:MAG: hypothetical protein K6T30_07575 [Alicyclobacillus sp.]|nr:hypothetical protein [Alicyclobacillus sp.]
MDARDARDPLRPSAPPLFADVRLPDGCTLRRKHTFEYTTPDSLYDIELFENTDGTWYAIGVPREGPLVVYGSNVVGDAVMALQVVIDKIRRERPPAAAPAAPVEAGDAPAE